MVTVAKARPPCMASTSKSIGSWRTAGRPSTADTYFTVLVGSADAAATAIWARN